MLTAADGSHDSEKGQVCESIIEADEAPPAPSLDSMPDMQRKEKKRGKSCMSVEGPVQQARKRECGVSCSFMCGAIKDHTLDPVEQATTPGSLEPIRWGRGATGSSSVGNNTLNDFWCERVFISKMSHLYKDRKQYQKELAQDRRKLDEHLKFRAELIENKIRMGKAVFNKEPKDRSNKKAVTSLQQSMTELVAPADKFYHWNDYLELFGHTKDPANKAKGHRPCRFGKYKGVAIPGEAIRGQSWDLKRSWKAGTQMQETIEEIGTDEEEDFEGQAQDKFDDTVEKQDGDLDLAITGMNYAELMAEIAAVEESDAEPAEAVDPDPVVSESDNNEVSEKKVRKRGLVLTSSEELTPRKKTKKTTALRPSLVASAAASSSTASGKQAFTTAAARHSSGSRASSAPPAVAVPKSKPEVIKPEPQPKGKPKGELKSKAEPKPKGEPQAKGRKGTDLVVYGEKLMTEFQTADGDSVFFDIAKITAQLRSLARYEGQVRQKIGKATSGSEDEAALQLSLKQLQVVESAIKVVRMPLTLAARNFAPLQTALQVLDDFMAQEPVIRNAQSPRWFILFRVERDMEANFGKDEEHTRLVSLLKLVTSEEQEQFVKQALTTVLREPVVDSSVVLSDKIFSA